MESLRVIVVGGGAAGFFGAIAACEANPHAQVILLEASNQPLAKVRISGGGRCNVTHACFDPKTLVQNYPRGGKALLGAFTRFQAKDTVAWFAAHGIQLKTEADNRMFPITDSSETIVNCLMDTAKAAGVKLRTGAVLASVRVIGQEESGIGQGESGIGQGASGIGQGASGIGQGASGIGQGALGIGQGASGMGRKTNNSQFPIPNSQFPIPNAPVPHFELILKSGEKLQCDRLLLATGSNPVGYKIAQQLGHTIEKPVPSLFTFNIRDENLRELAGVSVNSVKLRLTVPGHPQLEQTGSLLITHWGLSGPAVLKLSAWGARVLHSSNYQANLLINWLPHFKQEEVRQKLLAVKNDSPKRLIVSHHGVDLPHRLWQYIVQRAGINVENRWAELSNNSLNHLVQEITQGKYLIHGKGVFKEEFVTCGGVNLKEVNFKTMESKLVPGLFFAGEILDIDGVTGGFNFQSAWTTAYLAGLAMVNN